MNDTLFYFSNSPHSDLNISINHVCMNELGILGLVPIPRLEYTAQDSSGQQIVYSCELGMRRLMTLGHLSSFSEDENRALNFIGEAHVAMIALGYNSISTDEGDEVDFASFGIDLEKIAVAIAASNHLAGI